MKEQLVSFETAKLAKEKGFDIEVWAYFTAKGDLKWVNLKKDETNANSFIWYFSAPTQSLLQRWLREVHGIHINIDFGLQWGYQLIKHGTNLDFNEDFIDNKGWTSYEEALEAGLQGALKLIKI